MKTLNFKTAKQLIDMNISEYPMLVEGLLQKKGLAALVGPSDIGKSTLLRQLSIDVVTGSDRFIGKKINADHRSVIYISSEDDDISLSYLFNKTLPDTIKSHPGFENLKYVFQTKDLAERLHTHLAEQPADLIIIDAFSDVFTGDINRANEVRTYLNRYFAIAEKYNCLIVFLHHIGKGKEKMSPSKNNALGSQGFEAKVRVMIGLRKDQNRINRRILWILKGNLMDETVKSKGQVLDFTHQIFQDTGEYIDINDFTQNLTEPITVTAYSDFVKFQEANPDATLDDLTKMLNEAGIDISKTSVHKMQKKYRGDNS